MVNYVNTVLVGKGLNKDLAVDATVDSVLVPAIDHRNANKFVIIDAATGAAINAAGIPSTYNPDAIKIGYITNKEVRGNKGEMFPVVKWSNVIKRKDLKSYSAHVITSADVNTKDTIYLNFTSTDSSLLTRFGNGGIRILVRLTFKDMPTRYRKWTETYEYVTKPGDNTAAKIAKGIVDVINENWKRNRISAKQGALASGTFTESASGAFVQLIADDYTDDDAIDTINVANQIRFNANVYYTDPQAAGFASKNKYSVMGLAITKEPGLTYAGDWKLVRDHEAQAMGYEGILNRGEGTWPIIKPEMQTEYNAKYSYLTLEFETMYHAADDNQRHTKECLEVFEKSNALGTSGAQTFVVKDFIDAWLGNNTITDEHATTDIAD